MAARKDQGHQEVRRETAPDDQPGFPEAVDLGEHIAEDVGYREKDDGRRQDKAGDRDEFSRNHIGNEETGEEESKKRQKKPRKMTCHPFSWEGLLFCSGGWTTTAIGTDYTAPGWGEAIGREPSGGREGPG